MVQLYTPKAYPNLAGIVRHDLPKVPEDERKFRYFKEFAELSDEKARQILKPGSGPRLRVSDLGPGVFGLYRAGDKVHINHVIVYQHQSIIDAWLHASMHGNEDYDRWVALVKRATLILESVILHELVHWGDIKGDGVERHREALKHGWKDLGHWFVNKAYGSQFAVVREKVRGGPRTLKVPDMDIVGWLGWTTMVKNGKTVPAIYNPIQLLKPGSGPLIPPK